MAAALSPPWSRVKFVQILSVIDILAVTNYALRFDSGSETTPSYMKAVGRIVYLTAKVKMAFGNAIDIIGA